MNRGIMSLALEDNEPEVRDEPVAASATDFVDAPENDIAEAGEAAAEVETADAEISEATDTAETLDNMADDLEATVEEGGMGEGEAKAIETAVEHLCASVGFPPKYRKIVASMESFEKSASAEDRVKATKIAIESIKEKASKIWAQIVEAIKKALAYVEKFFKSLFDGAVKLEKRAESVAAAAKAAEGEHEAEHKVKVPGMLAIGGSIPDGSGIMAGFKKHMDTAVLKQDRAGALKKAVDEVGAMIGKDEAAAASAMSSFTTQFKQGGVSNNRSISVAPGDTLLEEKLEFGGKSLYTLLATKGASKAYIANSGGAKEAAGGEAAPVSASQAAELASAVAGHMKATYTSMEVGAREAKSAADALIKKVSDAAKEEGSNAQVISIATHTAIQLTVVAAVALKKYDITVSNAVLNFAAASIPKGKKAEVPADKEGQPA